MDHSNLIASQLIWILINFANYTNCDLNPPNIATQSQPPRQNDTLTTVLASLALCLIFGVLGCIFTFYCCGDQCRTLWCCCCCREDSGPDPDRRRPNQERTMLIPKDIVTDTLKGGRQESVDELGSDILDQIIPNPPTEETENASRDSTPPPPPTTSPKQLIRAPAFDIETDPVPVPKSK